MQTVRPKQAIAPPLARSFSGLMELYEHNYMRLRRLLPVPGELGGYAVSVAPGGQDLHYRLIEQCRYTSTFMLTYRFDNPDGVHQAPDLQIRMYQDARLAEVVSGVLHHHYVHCDRGRPGDTLVDPALGAVLSRWTLNRFLFKWMNFCLKQGHEFRPPRRWNASRWFRAAPPY